MLGQCIAFVVTVGLFWQLGLTFSWSERATLIACVLITLLSLWAYLAASARSAGDRYLAEVILVTFLLIAFTNIGSPAQYAAVALRLPYADWWLAAADAHLGVHVPSMAKWTREHPGFSLLMTLSYYSLAPQVFATLAGLALLKARDRLWEFAFHFQMTLIVAIVALALWPAICAPDYYQFRPTIPMDHLIAQIKGFHDGSMAVVRVEELEGLISLPSFHAACAFIVTWAFRDYRLIWIPLVVLNTALVASTSFTGAHYVIDIVASVPLFLMSVWCYTRFGRRLLLRDQRL